MSIRSYRDLLVWQRGMDVAEEVYRLTRAYPRDEQFGLTSQSRRAAVSVPANIAEGHGRGTRGAYAGFLRIARGSLKELETHLMLAERVGATAKDSAEKILKDTDELGRMLQSLITQLGNPKPPPTP